MILKRILLFFSFFFILQAEIFPQQHFFKRYSIEEGLSQSSVYCIIQDSRGFIWMGTDGGGLSLFDGMLFKTFTKSDGLSDNVVRCLFEDSKGNLWVGTDMGITLYDGYKFTVIGKTEGLNGSSVLKITEGSNGLIWAGTNDGGLAQINISDSVSVTEFTDKDGLISSNFIFDIYEDEEKKLWLGMVGGIDIIEFEDSTSKKIKNIVSPVIERGSVVSVLSVEADVDGSVLLGSYGNGLFRAEHLSGNNYDIEKLPVNNTIQGMIVWDISIRKDGEIWLATDKNGIIKLKDGVISGKFNRDNGLISNQILDIMIDKDGNSWFASFGQGAIMYRNDQFLSYGHTEGLTGNQVLAILFDTDDILYVATEEGFLSFRNDDGTIKRLRSYSPGNGLNNIGASTIIKKKNQFWIGTANGINILDGSELSSFKKNKELPDLKINALLADSKDHVWIGTNGGYGLLTEGNIFTLSQDEGLIHSEIQTIIEDREGAVWMGTIGGLVRLEGEKYSDYNAEDGLSFLRINCLAEGPEGNVWIGTFGGGLFKFDKKRDSVPVVPIAKKGFLSSNTINSLMFLNDSVLIAGTDKGFDRIGLDRNMSLKRVIHYGLDDGFTGGENNTNAVSRDNYGKLWFGTKSGLVRFDPQADISSEKPGVAISGIKLFFEDVNWTQRGYSTGRWNGLPENLVLPHDNNSITFQYTGLSFHDPEALTFSYSLEPHSKEWSPFNPMREIQFPGLSPGSYTFSVRAKNKYGAVSDIAEYKFTIKPPFWLTKWFISTSLFIFIAAVIVFIRLRERSLIKEKVKLEEIVKERTHEIVEQKNEIALQRDIVTNQNKEITDSINYAETIQRAVLPEEKILSKHFSDHFILFRPKDIVSGDFYWMSMKDGYLVVAAVDCTGHGVPGAFMSMLGVSYLNKIVNESGIVKPSEILNCLRENIITALKQEGSFGASKDGMDMAICSVDMKKRKLWFAGANNPLLIVRKEECGYELTERKGDMMPVGFYARMGSFTNNEFDIKKGDTIYLFSDGYMDQFGGAEGRKFMKSKLKQLLVSIQDQDMSSQKQHLEKTLDEWINYPSEEKKPFDQVDDIILIGIRI